MSQEITQETKKPTQCIMSFKRLKQIREIITKYYGDEKADGVMSDICDAINFNPDYAKNMYNPDKSEKLQQWRYKKAQEVGVSVSMIANGKYKKGLAAK